MKILILQDDYPPEAKGGAGVVAHAYAQEYERQGHTVRIISAAGLPRYHERWRAWRSLYNPAGVRHTKKVLQEFKPDLVHAHNVHRYLSYASLKSAKQSGATVILTLHDVMTFNYGKLINYTTYRISPWQQLREYKLRYNPLRNWIIRYYLRYPDHIVAVSNALRDACLANRVRVDRVVHNGIATDYSSVVHYPEEPTALFVNGNNKGSNEFLAALAKTSLRGIVVGDRGEMPAQDRVEFVGRVEAAAMPELYARASVVAVPSVCFDSLPTVILEAFACGRPVVATNLGGAREIVAEGTGFILDPQDSDIFAKALMATHELMGMAGRDRVQKVFNLTTQAGKYLSLHTS